MMENLHKGLHLFRQLLKQMGVGFFWGVKSSDDLSEASAMTTAVNIALSADYAERCVMEKEYSSG